VKDLDIEENIGDTNFIFELPKAYGGNLGETKPMRAKENNFMTFDIKTGA